MTHAVLRIGGAMALAALVSTVPALAQDQAAPAAKPAPAKPAAKPAAAQAKPAAPAKTAAPKAGATVGGPEAAAAADGNKSAWVKLCEKAPLVKKDKDGKDVKEEKNLCLTHHERLDGNTGMVLVSAAIREVEGQDKKSLMVMVPLGMAIPPGIRAAVYTKEQWGAVSKNEKVDDKLLKPVELKFSLCHPAGCTAETEATAEIIEQMKTGGGMMVVAMNASAQPIGFPVPLDGFADAYAGAPIDNKAYADARSQLMKQIRDRQAQLAEQHRKEQQDQAAAMRNLPGANTTGEDAPATTGSTAKAAPAPAPKN
ncbi:MAG TPA: invasion associated locus B family protein [Hyphomicrobium sp.]|nr:invasion associated locus B family protein [Hyphomicrobium sp.]